MEKKISGEVYVAIATALFLCQRKDDGPHDVENTTLTIKSNVGSAWSSKVLTLRQIPTVKK